MVSNGAIFTSRSCPVPAFIKPDACRSNPLDTPCPWRRLLPPLDVRWHAAALLVYDVTEPDSLERVKKWVAEVRLMGPPNMALVIAANKMDLLESPEDEDAAPSVSQGQQ